MADRTAALDQVTTAFRDALDIYVAEFHSLLAEGESPERAQAILTARLLDWGFNAQGLAGLLSAAINRLVSKETT